MEDIKPLTLRLPLPLWIYLKKRAVDKETTLTQLMVEVLKKYKKDCESV